MFCERRGLFAMVIGEYSETPNGIFLETEELTWAQNGVNVSCWKSFEMRF
jgi:hypothetical protein